jgi:hypothetical protein
MEYGGETKDLNKHQRGDLEDWELDMYERRCLFGKGRRMGFIGFCSMGCLNLCSTAFAGPVLRVTD